MSYFKFLTFNEFCNFPAETILELNENKLLLEGNRGPGKTQMISDAFEALMETAYKIAPYRLKPKVQNWTPGQGAPMRRGRRK